MVPWGQNTRAKFVYGHLSLQFSGDRSLTEYDRDLNGIIERSRDMRPVMRAIGMYMMGSIARNFKAEGRPSRWANLAPETIKDRQRRGYPPGPILQRSGALMASLTQPGAARQIFRAGPKSLQLGSRLVYANTHQFGDPSRNIPKRIMMLVQSQDRSQISRIINTYLRTGKVSTRYRQ